MLRISRTGVASITMLAVLTIGSTARAQVVSQTPETPASQTEAPVQVPVPVQVPNQTLATVTIPDPLGIKAAVKGEVKALRRGPLLIHGNYCGIGNRPGTAPIDALDTACMHHDACTKTGAMPSCSCDNTLRLEATAIAQDPSEPPNIQALATATAASMAVLICK